MREIKLTALQQEILEHRFDVSDSILESCEAEVTEADIADVRQIVKGAFDPATLTDQQFRVLANALSCTTFLGCAEDAVHRREISRQYVTACWRSYDAMFDSIRDNVTDTDRLKYLFRCT